MYLPSKFKISETEAQGKRLVSQLDQLNTYMLLLTPILPEPYQSEWKSDLVDLSRILISQFYDPLYNVFWHDIEETENMNLAAKKGNEEPYTDYGHSIKIFLDDLSNWQNGRR